jgi:glycosyltransferase involved in cell wall biosynthesis
VKTNARIALDGTLFDEPTTGIGLYARALFRALAPHQQALEVWGAKSSGAHRRQTSSRSRFVWFELPQLLRRNEPTVYHALGNFNLPWVKTSAARLVLTVHDLIPLRLPHTVSRAFHWQFRVALARAVRVADAIVCVSETTQRLLHAAFPESEQKTNVIYHGVDHTEWNAPADRIAHQWIDALALPEHFVLYAGSLDMRKNVELVLRAVSHLHRGGLPATLVVVGQTWFGSGPVQALLAALMAQGVDIRVLGHLHDSVFFEVMRRASAFAFCSLDEGFGLPPLEAMALGVPTVVSRAGALPEICGEGAQYVGTNDTVALADALAGLLTSPAARQRWSQRARTRAASFLWSKTAAQTSRIYFP